MPNNILFHVCCGPCLIAPYTQLENEQVTNNITAYWYNNNIHPYKEYQSRLKSLTEWTNHVGIPLIVEESYNPRQFMRRINCRENERCYLCYYFRLLKTVQKAKKDNYSSFSTTLLYSIYKKHDLIKQIGEQLAQQFGIDFYYRDFRNLWSKGKEMSIKAEMYRQKYCGCLYSEEDRYRRKADYQMRFYE